MCTVSWIHADGGYELFCNRDEKRTRLEADPPRIIQRDGVRIAAPRDGDSGGTWIAVNEFGLTLCLLNGASSPGRWSNSRGEVVMSLASSATAAQAIGRLLRFDLAKFAAFTMVALEPGCAAIVLEWNTRELSAAPDGDAAMPLTSSSLDPGSVRLRRQREFERLTSHGRRLDVCSLEAFHRSHLEQPGALSPCMHRGDAATVSFSRISAARDSIEFTYTPGSPCEDRGRQSIRLERIH